MWRSVRAIAVAMLAVAVLGTTPGVCLCHHGPDSPVDEAGSHSCCHHGRLVIQASGQPCCQIERAQHNATSLEIVMIAPPAATVVPADARPSTPVLSQLACAAFDASPPGQILRL